jgi:hypothetical protein
MPEAHAIQIATAYRTWEVSYRERAQSPGSRDLDADAAHVAFPTETSGIDSTSNLINGRCCIRCPPAMLCPSTALDPANSAVFDEEYQNIYHLTDSTRAD